MWRYQSLVKTTPPELFPPAPTPALALSPASGLGRRHYIALAAIILMGALLRFAWLDRPVLWGDEAATWARTCGTFREMLATNRGDGFVPLHYELYWALGKLWKLTPWRMRLVPAIAGTLMVPAMYFLARQLVHARTSLLGGTSYRGLGISAELLTRCQNV